MKTCLKSGLALLVAVVLSACQSSRGPTVLFRPSAAVAAAAPAEPAAAEESAPATNAAPLGALEAVRTEDDVKVYGVNRYVDPVDGRVLHERHAVYRMERPAGWITRQRDHRGEVLLGPVVGLRRAEYRPEPIPGEAAQALAEQRRSLQETADGVQSLRDEQRQLGAGVERLAKQSADAQAKLTTIVTVLNERLRRLEGEGSGNRNRAEPAEGATTEPEPSGGAAANRGSP